MRGNNWKIPIFSWALETQISPSPRVGLQELRKGSEGEVARYGGRGTEWRNRLCCERARGVAKCTRGKWRDSAAPHPVRDGTSCRCCCRRRRQKTVAGATPCTYSGTAARMMVRSKYVTIITIKKYKFSECFRMYRDITTVSNNVPLTKVIRNLDL